MLKLRVNYLVDNSILHIKFVARCTVEESVSTNVKSVRNLTKKTTVTFSIQTRVVAK